MYVDVEALPGVVAWVQFAYRHRGWLWGGSSRSSMVGWGGGVARGGRLGWVGLGLVLWLMQLRRGRGFGVGWSLLVGVCCDEIAVCMI